VRRTCMTSLKTWPRVYPAEEPDLEDSDEASALFSRHVEFGADIGDQLDGVALRDALRWGGSMYRSYSCGCPTAVTSRLVN
jgi:hypothetical protein